MKIVKSLSCRPVVLRAILVGSSLVGTLLTSGAGTHWNWIGTLLVSGAGSHWN